MFYQENGPTPRKRPCPGTNQPSDLPSGLPSVEFQVATVHTNPKQFKIPKTLNGLLDLRTCGVEFNSKRTRKKVNYCENVEFEDEKEISHPKKKRSYKRKVKKAHHIGKTPSGTGSVYYNEKENKHKAKRKSECGIDTLGYTANATEPATNYLRIVRASERSSSLGLCKILLQRSVGSTPYATKFSTTSPYHGVFVKQNGRGKVKTSTYRAIAKVGTKNLVLGDYDNELDAATAVDEATIKHKLDTGLNSCLYSLDKIASSIERKTSSETDSVNSICTFIEKESACSAQYSKPSGVEQFPLPINCEKHKRGFNIYDIVSLPELKGRGLKHFERVGKIVSVHENGKYDIKLIVSSLIERNIDGGDLQPYDVLAQNSVLQDHFSTTSISQSQIISLAAEFEEPRRHMNERTPSNFVRRSLRCPGRAQLRRPAVVDLFYRLNQNDESLKILRLKNYLEADTNSLVLTELFKILSRKTSVVQVLYAHNLECAMNDTMLKELTDMLKRNPRIWALNVGENFKVSQQGWETFAEDLRHTSITHLYAGSESSVYGDLKKHMRDIIRENRKKHSLHVDPTNLDVILQIGQMWWNPKNSKHLQPYLKQIIMEQHNSLSTQDKD